MCFFRTMKMVVERMKRTKEQESLSVIFDLDTQLSGGRIKHFIEIKSRDSEAARYLSAITFADSKVFIPLQAADLLAWETRKSLMQKTQGYADTPRWKELFTALPDIDLDYASELWDEEAIDSKLSNLS